MTGIELMVTGMGIVFGFLTLLVLAVNMLAVLVERYFPVQSTSQQTEPVSATARHPNDIAAITTAIAQYRKKYR